jgi:hypothetical protein
MDGDIGRCHDFLFDDRDWVVRYMVAKTAKWLPGRKVIISPVFLDTPDWGGGSFPVRMTREQIEEAPPLEEHAPVSKQYEISYHQYYALPFYWIGQDLWGAYPDPTGVIHPVSEPPRRPAVEDTDVEEGHLRSTREVSGYRIRTSDGDVGHVEDFLVDDQTWALRYLVVDTRDWLPGRKVLVSPQWIRAIHWSDESVEVDLDSESIRNSPPLDPSQPIERSHETALHDHYGRPYYWE